MKYIKTFEVFESNDPVNSIHPSLLDGNGEPLVLYHGSPSDSITEFRTNFDGIFFSDNIEVAQGYSGVAGLSKIEYSQQIIEILDAEHDDIISIFNTLKPHGFTYKWTKERGIYGEVKEYYLLVDKDGNEYEISKYTRPFDLKHKLVKRGKNYAVHLNMQNPLTHDCKNSRWDNISFNGEKTTTMHISLDAKENGYDGVILYNIYEHGVKCNVYIVYNSDQMKILN